MHALIKSVAVAAAISSVVAIESAHAGLTLTPTGVGLGFSLSTYYTDPAVSYGMLQATTAPDGSVIATTPTLPPNGTPRPSPEQLESIFQAHGQTNVGPPLAPHD